MFKNKGKKRKTSMRWQALIAALLSLILAVGFFCLTRQVFPLILNANPTIFEDFDRSQNDKELDSFEEFVERDGISSTDLDEIDRWVRARFVSMEMIIVIDDAAIYNSNLYKYEVDSVDSRLSSYAINSNENYYRSTEYYNNSGYFSRDVSFADGEATVFIYVAYAYQLYVAMIIAGILLSALVFSISFVLLVNRKIKYVSQLEGEVRMLETGGLEYPITEKGNDELSSLASGINHLRVSLAENIEKEEEAVKANYDLVVAVSHDLRTPLLTLTLYLV